jgi:four helix bundle protein
MNNKEFSRHLEVRTKKFAISIIKMSAKLPETMEGKVVRNQVTKSGTSIGANYREANRSRSKADFINKIMICESEASETLYWLEIISDLDWSISDKIQLVVSEATEILAIFTSIDKNIKNPS